MESHMGTCAVFLHSVQQANYGCLQYSVDCQHMKYNVTGYATLAGTLRLCLFHWALGGRKRVTLFSFPSAKIIVKCE